MSKRVWLTILLIVILISLSVLFRSQSQSLLLQGEVDAPEVIISSKVKGRVVEKFAERGDNVKPGELLVALESHELLARLHSLEAARDKAKSELEQSLNGTREESVRALRAEFEEAESSYVLADRNYRRYVDIARKGYISDSDLDAARRSRDVALNRKKMAKANLDKGIRGDRTEQREIYAAALRQATQDIRELKVQLDELAVRAPVSGEVGVIPAETGELLNASSPLMTLIRLQDAYFIFNLREDILSAVHKNDRVKILVPALNNKMIEAEVRYIAPMGDFATKRATRATGDFDLKTFEVRLYPLQPVDGLRQGMSALWQWEK
ncbi:TPA: HlyD family efflux transporter periplasmic adaptor subunit [Raoultella planticola]|nr:HlyD family efflux transporter periplasmic adaptor subunit [Raoultella planticola]